MIVGADKSADCEEFTMCKFEGNQSDEFIALALALDWEREGDKGKKSPLLNKDMVQVGISNKSHRKTVNLIQILYMTSTSNAMA